jgi:hypothetical protein
MEGYKKILTLRQSVGSGDPAIFAPEAERFDDPFGRSSDLPTRHDFADSRGSSADLADGSRLPPNPDTHWGYL